MGELGDGEVGNRKKCEGKHFYRVGRAQWVGVSISNLGLNVVLGGN